MSDKSPSLPDQFSPLPGHRVLALEGRDAAKFAQAQFTNDVDGLADGHWQWSGWLTPKGRIVALFALLRFDAERLWLLLPDADPADLAAQLQRFVFRTKVTLRPLEAVHAAAAFTAPQQATGSAFAGDEDSGVELDMGTPAGARTLRLGATTAPVSDDVASRWSAFDLSHGWPRLDPDQTEKWTPQQLSLQRLRAYSVKKGCYPGQEIVARTHFLGQAKRGLVRLQVDSAVASGDAVTSGEREIGRVVCAAGREALAVLPLEREDAPLAIGGTPCMVAALEDGLAR
ncbi:CAF17-like 4Fe-4S cluster assembly/insertion protein YgfZ [Luteimonas sp. A478]